MLIDPNESSVTVHSFEPPYDSPLSRWLTDGVHFHGSFVPIVGPVERLVARLSGPTKVLDEALDGLPEGPARWEAAAVRLRRGGVTMRPGRPEMIQGFADLRRWCADFGASSVEVYRADPSLITELRLGAWWQAAWKARLLRRVLLRAPRMAGVIGRATRSLAWRISSDAAFWNSARRAATTGEWSRLTRSSYVALCYHRLAGEAKEGQENLDVDPDHLFRQLRILRRLGYSPLDASEQIAFHAGRSSERLRRRFVVTVDDAYSDVVVPLQACARVHPQLFVPTAAAGLTSSWLDDDEPVATWEQLRALQRRGVILGAHSRTHAHLPEADDERLGEELEGSLKEIKKRTGQVSPLLAYPYGAHDLRVRARAGKIGYRLAFTTEVGRNGAGTDPLCLRRIGVYERDKTLAFVWKVITGELLPPAWERRRRST